MERILSILESFLSHPLLWGVFAVVALAIALSGRLSVNAASTLLWVAFAAAIFGVFRAGIPLRNDPVLRYLILVAISSSLAIGTVLLQRWFSKPATEIVTVPSTAQQSVPSPLRTESQNMQGAPAVNVKPTPPPADALNKSKSESPRPKPSLRDTRPVPNAVRGDDAFHEKPPDVFYFSLGEHGMTAGNSLKILTDGKASLFQMGDFVPVKVHLDDGIIYCDVTIWGGFMGPPIEIVHNEFRITPPNWDRNFSANALEVVDERNEPIFQLIRKTPNHYVMNGLMALPDGSFILATDNGTWTGIRSPKMPPGTLKPIFKYPSWKHPGEYVE
jgi:hypothetical protein